MRCLRLPFEGSPASSAAICGRPRRHVDRIVPAVDLKRRLASRLVPANLIDVAAQLTRQKAHGGSDHVFIVAAGKIFIRHAPRHRLQLAAILIVALDPVQLQFLRRHPNHLRIALGHQRIDLAVPQLLQPLRRLPKADAEILFFSILGAFEAEAHLHLSGLER